MQATPAEHAYATVSCAACFCTSGAPTACMHVTCLAFLKRAHVTGIQYLWFSTGKTTLLVALILFLREARGPGAQRGRVLVAAHTNAAVDRILLGLAAHGFTGCCMRNICVTALILTGAMKMSRWGCMLHVQRRRKCLQPWRSRECKFSCTNAIFYLHTPWGAQAQGQMV